MQTRAHTLAIVAHEGITQDELWKTLHPLWSDVQRAANAAVAAYFSHDGATLAENKHGKMTLPPLDKHVAAAAREAAIAAAPTLQNGMVRSIDNACQFARKRYLADRWACRVSIRQSVPTFRSPLPLVMKETSWHIMPGPADEKGRTTYLATFPLPGMNRADRPVVRFVCKTARDADLLGKIASGEYEKRTLEILSPGWKRKGAIRAKVVYRRPDAEPREAAGTLRVRTTPECLLVASVNGGEPMRWNVRWLRSRILAYEQWRLERAEDMKHERRIPSKRREIYREDSGRRAEKHRNRVRTTLQQVAAQVVGRAIRCGCSTIEYDDTDRSWIAQFPWHELRDRMKQCAETKGVVFTAKTIES